MNFKVLLYEFIYNCSYFLPVLLDVLRKKNFRDQNWNKFIPILNLNLELIFN